MAQRIREIRVNAATNIPAGGSGLTNVTRLLEVLDSVVSILSVSVTTLAPLQYRYRIDLVDGRAWTQILTFASAADRNPSMTFAVPAPGWKLTEFVSQRDLRDAIIGLIADHGLISVDYEFQ